MDALWDQILELSSKVLIPDWRELIGLLPLGVAGLVVLWFAWTFLRYATAGPIRRRPARVSPVTPPGLHMPGPSAAPVIAALSTGLLFVGLVFGGIWITIGVTALVLGLLYWGREAIRDFDQLAPGTPGSSLPAVVHPGPPPGVHMPGPSFRPVLGALGTAALLGGLVFGGWLLAAGAVFFVATLIGWLTDAKAEYVKTEAADVTGHLENIPDPAWPRRLVPFFAVVFVLAALVQTGVFPPSDGGVAPGPTTSAEPTLPPGTLVVTAKGVAFLEKELTVPAGQPFTIHFVNEDPPSIPHDVDIRATDGKTVLTDQDTINGGATADYTYAALEAGEYLFICSVHPFPAMTGTLTVE